jgi:ABC-2 type transport system ATP-binding protein
MTLNGNITTAPTGSALEVEALVHRYGDHPALQGVSLEVASGELFGILGPNGGGKTTLLRAVCTLLRPTGGRTRVFGVDAVADPAGVRRYLGVVFQNNALDAELTLRENLRCQGALVGLRGRELEARIEHLLGDFGLAERADDRVKTLSGGLARRTDLARGLLHRPPLLLLDEPTTGLDPTARRELWTALSRLRRDEGTTILVATHMMDEAERCDRVAILDRGRVAGVGSPAGLRAEMGGEALWLETRSPELLASNMRNQLGLDSRRIGDALLVETDDAPAALSRALAAFGEMIDSATVRRPTLDDVFAARTGARIDPVYQPEPVRS